jgi:hypothetical protein
MNNIELRAIFWLLSLSAAWVLQGCASPSVGETIYYCIGFETDKRLGKVTDADFQYNREAFRHHMEVGSVRAGYYCAPMAVPESFEVSWKTSGGNLHVANVPVRPLLHGSITGKKLVFIFTPEGVDGFVEEGYREFQQFVRQNAKTIPAL